MSNRESVEDAKVRAEEAKAREIEAHRRAVELQEKAAAMFDRVHSARRPETLCSVPTVLAKCCGRP